MAPTLYSCIYCPRGGFESQRALTQHVRSSKKCLLLRTKGFKSRKVSQNANELLSLVALRGPQSGNNLGQYNNRYALNSSQSTPTREQNVWNRESNTGQNEPQSDDDYQGMMLDDDNKDPQSSNDACSDVGTSDPRVSKIMLEDWLEYEKKAKSFSSFTRMEVNSMQLLSILRQSKASLNTCDKVMEWHFEANGRIRPSQSLASVSAFLNRKKLFNAMI